MPVIINANSNSALEKPVYGFKTIYSEGALSPIDFRYITGLKTGDLVIVFLFKAASSVLNINDVISSDNITIQNYMTLKNPNKTVFYGGQSDSTQLQMGAWQVIRDFNNSDKICIKHPIPYDSEHTLTALSKWSFSILRNENYSTIEPLYYLSGWRYNFYPDYSNWADADLLITLGWSKSTDNDDDGYFGHLTWPDGISGFSCLSTNSLFDTGDYSAAGYVGVQVGKLSITSLDANNRKKEIDTSSLSTVTNQNIKIVQSRGGLVAFKVE